MLAGFGRTDRGLDVQAIRRCHVHCVDALMAQHGSEIGVARFGPMLLRECVRTFLTPAPDCDEAAIWSRLDCWRHEKVAIPAKPNNRPTNRHRSFSPSAAAIITAPDFVTSSLY